jgi:DNA-binding transcriptional ArsR family regulator
MPPPDSSHPLDSLRRVSDAKTMRALAHPVRIALIELLVIAGPMTATAAAERIGESPTTCSFHLRQLAKYGFVEEAGGGRGRNRPWRVSSVGMTMGAAEGDPEADLAATALQRMFRERHLRRLEHWRETRASYPKEWRDLAAEGEYLLWVTPEELAEVERDLALVLMRYPERMQDPSARPAGARAVEALSFIFPLDLDSAGGPEPPAEPAPQT